MFALYKVYQFQIADRHPLKQGLKLYKCRTVCPPSSNRRPTSTKTRIETRLPVVYNSPSLHIADRHPLKQGLKLVTVMNDGRGWAYRRPTSTKTRIETSIFLD